MWPGGGGALVAVPDSVMPTTRRLIPERPAELKPPNPLTILSFESLARVFKAFGTLNGPAAGQVGAHYCPVSQWVGSARRITPFFEIHQPASAGRCFRLVEPPRGYRCERQILPVLLLAGPLEPIVVTFYSARWSGDAQERHASKGSDHADESR